MTNINLNSDSQPSFARKFDSFILNFMFNQRGQFWHMNISTVDDELICTGICLVFGKDLLDGFRNDKTPLGELYLIKPMSSNLTSLNSQTLADLVLQFKPF